MDKGIVRNGRRLRGMRMIQNSWRIFVVRLIRRRRSVGELKVVTISGFGDESQKVARHGELGREQRPCKQSCLAGV
jgi:hypothetical protein